MQYFALAAGTMAIGLLLHVTGLGLSATIRDKLGDALWAAMMLWWVSALIPRSSLPTRSAVALAVCVVVEVSQLYTAQAIDAARQTLLGQLVLGSGFDPRDFAAYAVGVLAAAFIDRALSSLEP